MNAQENAKYESKAENKKKNEKDALIASLFKAVVDVKRTEDGASKSKLNSQF